MSEYDIADDWNEDENADDNVNVQTQSNGLPLMRFCPLDSSMLFPKEDRRNRRLLYACRQCDFSEVADPTGLVYVNRLRKGFQNALITVPSAISEDPTMARSNNVKCTNCGHTQAVFFQSDTSDIRSESLALIFVCCNLFLKL
mmetsp:Transcript_40129/g.94307  ORF Transcript_40129/g.94307 Transcript_40129/m.94307 type:complete len:143 (+) Transcript_40129:3511-3939(+)